MQVDPLSGRALQFKPNVTAQGTVQQLGFGPGGELTAQEFSIPGALQARIETTVPQAGQNMRLVNMPGGGVGAIALPGAQAAVQQLSAAESLGRAAGQVVAVTNPDGSISQVPLTQFLNQQPTAPQTQGQPTPTGQTAPIGQPRPTAPPRTQSAFDVSLQKSFERAFEKSQKDADLASSRRATLDQMQLAINNPQFQTGRFADQKTGLVSALNWFGVTGNKANSYLASAESARAGFANLANESIQELSGPMSDKDILFSRDRNAKVTDIKDSVQFAIDVARAADSRKSQKFEFLRDNAGPRAESEWKKTPAGSTSIFEEPNMRRYLPSVVLTQGPNRGKTAYKLPDGTVKVFD
jgi:hypothetical protein